MRTRQPIKATTVLAAVLVVLLGASSCLVPPERNYYSPDLPPDSFGCVCPGPPMRMTDPCDFEPVVGTVSVKLSKACDSTWYFPNTSVCRVELTSGNTNVLVLVPNVYDLTTDEDTVIVSTAAFDPSSHSQPPDATLTAVDKRDGTQLAAGSVRVTDACPTEEDD